MHKHNMDAIAPLVILLLVSGAAGASKHADRSAAAAAAVTSSSRTMAPMEYWRAVLPLTPIPRAIHDLLTHSTVHVSQDSKGVDQGKNTDAMENHQSQGEGFVKGPQKIGKGNEVEMKMQLSGAQFKEDENVLMLKGMNNHFNFYGTNAKEDLKKISTSYTSQIQKAPRKTTESYGYQGNEDDLRKVTLSYRSQGEDLRTISTSYGSQGEDLMTISTSYGSQGKDLRTVSTSYGSQGEDLRTVSTSYGFQGEDLRTVSASYDSQGEDLRTISTSYGSQSEDPSSMITIYDHKTGVSEKGEASKGDRHDPHVHNHNNGNKLAAVFFFHDVLRPGSVITPTIPVTTTLPSLLPRREADSLPFSTARLGDILAMFSPASLTMADEIRTTLDSCEHPRPLPGEKPAAPPPLSPSQGSLLPSSAHAMFALSPATCPSTRRARRLDGGGTTSRPYGSYPSRRSPRRAMT
ncbi:hypothetical protein C2845_PM10G09910 [Panicum miliaceum]|uniref:BURP domain-containing protein n=1 Tax=Panicum miliaceum TaxID=4540 RepID=A0A3L6PA65_PANMI|nr:hypothetical protein C2845_PM10G09910 [Panicum miliaceum]